MGDQKPDIGLAAVMQRIDILDKDIQQLHDNLSTLVAELRAGRPIDLADRAIISEALAIAKDDTDFFQVQVVGALQRLSERLNAITMLFVQTNEPDSPQTNIKMRRPRPLPVIKRKK